VEASVFVCWLMLPPTITTAPISATAEPSAAMIATSTPTQASRSASSARAGQRAP